MNQESNSTKQQCNKQIFNSRFYIGKRLWQFYGNGCRFDTIIKVEKFHIELAGEGRITKIDASKRWNA